MPGGPLPLKAGLGDGRLVLGGQSLPMSPQLSTSLNSTAFMLSAIPLKRHRLYWLYRAIGEDIQHRLGW